MTGRIRIGRSKYINGKTIIPTYQDFKPIVALTKQSSPYGELGPYHMTNDQGQILENVWQFSKVYAEVPEVSIPYSSYNSKIVWSWGNERHIDNNGNFTKEFWKKLRFSRSGTDLGDWRITGKNNLEPVRNPVGWKVYKNCLFSLEKDEPISQNNPKLSYIEARKKIYLPIYMKSIVNEPKFYKLVNMLLEGQNLLIVELDGPHQESLDYYKDKYGVGDDFIVDDSVKMTEENLCILLNDDKYPFGHGYCLAWSLYCHILQLNKTFG